MHGSWIDFNIRFVFEMPDQYKRVAINAGLLNMYTLFGCLNKQELRQTDLQPVYY